MLNRRKAWDTAAGGVMDLRPRTIHRCDAVGLRNQTEYPVSYSCEGVVFSEPHETRPNCHFKSSVHWLVNHTLVSAHHVADANRTRAKPWHDFLHTTLGVCGSCFCSITMARLRHPWETRPSSRFKARVYRKVVSRLLLASKRRMLSFRSCSAGAWQLRAVRRKVVSVCTSHDRS